MKIIRHIFLMSILFTGLFTSCTGDLDQYPHIEETGKTVYTSVENYKMALAKLYASFVICGQEKGGGNADFSTNKGYDYMRSYINLQELPTDEVAYTWSGTIYNICQHKWDASDIFVSDMYYQIYFTISICNEFLRNATEDRISGFSDSEKTKLRSFRSEARFLRALAYSHALDLFGNIPFVTEADPVGIRGFFPPQYSQKQVFDFLISELSALEIELPESSQAEYGRVSKAAANSLLARLYLNAEVYTDKSYYTECIDACNKIISNPFTLENNYPLLFNADNHLRTNEIIFAFSIDATHTVSWGATSYLICAAVSSSNKEQNPADYGVESGWTSFRAKGALTSKFDDGDKRAMFFKKGQSQYVTTMKDAFTGYLFEKWTNLTDDGKAASNTAADGASTDFPLFRLSEIYLMYAEAVLRGGTDSKGNASANALNYVNKVRQRAYGNNSGDINAGQLTLNFILDERARELHLECTRRTDLIRFDKFTSGDYLWEFKGGVAEGKAIDTKYNLYPIPETDLSANSNMKQNTGY
ncbi:RagB/SusD family nutrient uptake outer membrane protein [Dysgonomonas sp. Marseille-P4677]|uniref:RagB/SusD family nutrient uptake outer membrane protein n=1 Tax=Dysgonomonas sp. Marseille-P4677 TaxID=2364790 RepID=UPI001912ADDE|nr:RagB/SusD family nutrient uptake outer membrane protein [Dysgonomonas sp. Marseille-P4677]MBK5721050.1 RagB/SusD family nutrient uptake outer membrane protein [Dysgonomonas sp. Marseille-P4677]